MSLHAPTNELRDQLVPINQKYPLEELIPACRDFIKGDKRRKITWEYVMLDGINDSIQHAKALIRLLEGTPSKLNLIPFNPFPGTSYKTSPRGAGRGISPAPDESGASSPLPARPAGEDIDAACGPAGGAGKGS